MSKAVVIERYTYDDYKLWKGDWELIEGHPLAMSPSPVKAHQNVSKEMLLALYTEVEKCKECEVVYELDYIIDEENVLRPDVALICNEENDYITKPPKIVVEVISPATARRDEKVKFEIYQDEKVPFYVLIYPRTLVAKVYKLDDKKYTLEGVFSNEKYKFLFDECEVEVDFQRVFKKFKKAK
jgi:Uma2 family endonuclease